MRELIYTLEWARVCLYPLEPGSSVRGRTFGEPDLNNPVTIGSSVEGRFEAIGLRLIERSNFTWKRPSGRRHPIGRQLGSDHTIEIERLWTNIVSQAEVRLDANVPYVMRIMWKEAAPKDPPVGTGRTYYGVYATQSVLRPGDGAAFVGEDAFAAAYFTTIYDNTEVL